MMKPPVHASRAGALLLCATAVLLTAQDASAQGTAQPAYESAFVQVRGIRMHYLDFGGSGLPVIFLHGGHGDARNFVDFAPRFADGYRVLALDRRGKGQSEMVDWGYGTAAQAEDVLGFMDALGLERPVLIGFHRPVATMTYLAEHHPDRLTGVVYLAHEGPAIDSRRDPAVLKVDAEGALGRLGLEGHLSAQRSNGLRAMVARLRELAEAAAAG
jgi:pimeloyl-ACP methyl ester carboxylesterase